MIYVIDNEKFLDKKYHFNIVEPFSDNVNYKIILLNDFENYISHLVDVNSYLIKYYKKHLFEWESFVSNLNLSTLQINTITKLKLWIL